jgi:hypothetical protein
MMVRPTNIRTCVISIATVIERQLKEARDHAAIFVKILQTNKQQFVAMAIVRTMSRSNYQDVFNTSK